MTAPGLLALATRAGLRLPEAVTVAVTGACNLACGHCWVEAGTPASDGDAPAEAVVRLVEEAAGLGCEAAWLTGGEPLRHPEWHRILARCGAVPGLRVVGLQTNGTLLDAAAVGRLTALPRDRLRVEVSLDGASPATHDRVRGAGAFAAALSGLERLAAAGLGGRTSIAFTEMRHNMDDVPALLALADRLGLRGVTGGTLVRGGRAAAGALEPPSPDQYRRLLRRHADDARFRELYARYGRFSALEWRRGRPGARGDPCDFLRHPYVTAAGRLHACALCRAEAHAVGGALEAPFEAALRAALLGAAALREAARRRSALPACRACTARPWCEGGCMGRALAAHGALEAIEDRCALRLAVHGTPGAAGGADGAATD